MKKVLAIFLAFIIGLSMSAQIQNMPLGFKLGSTTESQVRNQCKNNNQDVFTNNYGEIVATSYKFAGYKWDYFIFSFHNNKLCGVRMGVLSPINSMWQNLKESLNKKYRGYYISKNSNSNCKVYSDGKTTIILSFTPGGGQMSPVLELRYTDVSLLRQKHQDEESEL